MDKLSEQYENLTSVNIEQQKTLWDERGKGYYGEYLLFRTLFQSVQGQCKILMNLQIPTQYGTKTEIDLLLIHETGLYAFEAKHYKGTIYGNTSDKTWTQYFRTQKNSHFGNPIKQNAYHIDALRELYPNIPIRSVIVFTNDEVELRISGARRDDVLLTTLSGIQSHQDPLFMSEIVLTPEQIDRIFSELSEYAPMKNAKTQLIDGVVVPLSDYVATLAADFNQALEERTSKIEQSYKAKQRGSTIACAIACAAMLILAIVVASGAKTAQSKAEQDAQYARDELAEFAKQFEHVSQLNGGDIELRDDFCVVSDVVLKPSSDLKDTVWFSCRLTVNGDTYAMHIRPTSKYLVQLKDGRVQEYVFQEHFNVFVDKYAGPGSGYRQFVDLEPIQLFDVAVDDIAYIKLSEFSICTAQQPLGDLLPGIEIELYSAQ